MAVVIPFSRTLKRGKRGGDVRALQRALRRMGYKPATTGIYGKGTYRSVRQFQKSHPNLKVDGIYGPNTHTALSNSFNKKKRRAYDAYGVWLIQKWIQRHRVNPVERAMQKLKDTATLAYNKRYQINYTQTVSRMSGVRYRIRPPAVPRYEDCSSFVTWLYWVAGCPDPNGGTAYSRFGVKSSPQGYTGTLSRSGQRISMPSRIGDLCFYGYSHPWKHVTMVIGYGRVVSFGSQSGPHIFSPGYRPDLKLTLRKPLVY